MGNISTLTTPDNTTYDIVSKTGRGIVRATMGSTSTATAFVLTADGITSLYDGLLIICKNIKIASAANCTLNLNGLGAKRIWLSQSNSYCTTHWALNQTYLFIYDATNARWELQQGRDTNSDTYDRLRFNANIKCGTTAIVAANIIVAGSDGLYKHLKLGTAFDIRYPILYAGSAIAASATGTNNYLAIHLTITTTQSITLTAYKPVYIKGTLSGTTFTPVSTTPLTQTLPSSSDAYQYMLLGIATNSTTMYLIEDHEIYTYSDGQWGKIAIYAENANYSYSSLQASSAYQADDADTVNGHTVEKDVPSNAVFTDTNTKVTQTNTTTNANYRVLFSENANDTTETKTARKSSKLQFNPSTGTLITEKLENGNSAKASGNYSHAEGAKTTASGNYSHAEGGWIDEDENEYFNIASGIGSHAEGADTTASNVVSHTEGFGTITNGDYSHAEGEFTETRGAASHSEGTNTVAKGYASHAEGDSSVANGRMSHAEGQRTSAIGEASHSEGQDTYAARGAHSEGSDTTASGNSSHAEGARTCTSGVCSHAEGFSTTATVSIQASGRAAHAEGFVGSVSGTASDNYHPIIASGDGSHAEGAGTTAQGMVCHTEGFNTYASLAASHAEGRSTSTKSSYSHTEGLNTVTNATYAHAEGGTTRGDGIYAHAEGASTTAKGQQAHAEGLRTCAFGNQSHTEGSDTRALQDGSHAEGNATTANGDHSHVEGNKCITRGSSAHAEGNTTSAQGAQSHAEGKQTTTVGDSSHAEGYYTYTPGAGAHAEGYQTTSAGSQSHSEGYKTSAIANYSHAEGNQATASGDCSHTEGLYTYASEKYSHAEGHQTTANGQCSHAEGYATSTVEYYAHSEGYKCIANGGSAHAEGNSTTATGGQSHAEGLSTCAKGNYSHAEGHKATTIGECSHAEGLSTYVTVNYSHAQGGYTTASNGFSLSMGHYNAAMTTGGNYNNTTGTAFVIGNGTSGSALKNAFSVQFNGVVKAANTITASTTADYAEYFEWADGNPNKEDRVGHFVTFTDENKIRIANDQDDYILGVVSGAPFVLGNGDCDVWNGMILRDEFGRIIYQPTQKMEYNEETGEMEPVYDEQGNPVYEGTAPVINPNYDPTIPYISRADRPEWSAIGMLGVLAVIDDGTCEVNKYCTINSNGIATKANAGAIIKYRVIKRKTENVIDIVFR